MRLWRTLSAFSAMAQADILQSSGTGASGRLDISALCSALEEIDLRHVDGAAVAEIDDDDSEPDRGLRRCDREHNQCEHLSDEVAMEGGEGDEIEIHRKQHQLDAHENDDHILAVQEDTENAEREQDRGNREVMGEVNGHPSPLPV